MDRYKSSTHVALSRDAVYFIINGDLSKKLQQALKPFNFAEESFFAILQYNPSSSMPGGLIIDGNDNRIKRQKSMRYKFWIHSKEELERCYSRRIVRDICCIGVKTLPELVGSFYGKVLFLNKFPWFFEPMAWDCMNLWHHSKVSLELSTKSVPANFSNLGNGSQVIWSRKSKSSARWRTNIETFSNHNMHFINNLVRMAFGKKVLYIIWNACFTYPCTRIKTFL